MDDNLPTSAGLSSFNLLDEQKLFEALNLQPGMSLLDLACGVGNYSIWASPQLGETGRIYAVDPWEEGIETLEVRTGIGQIGNIRAWASTALDLEPVDDASIDLCLMATVAHIFVHEDILGPVLSEVQRVLKPDGLVAVVEFYKVEGSPDPPMHLRIEPDELAEIFSPYGFDCTGTTRVGNQNYLSLFSRRD